MARLRAKFNAEFGAFVRERRQACGLTQIVFAGRAGMGAGRLQHIEAGAIPPRTTVQALAEAAGDDVSIWLSHAGYSTEYPTAEELKGANVSGVRVAAPSTAQIPVIGDVHGDIVTRPEADMGEVFPALEEHAEQADYGCARVKGDSMEPELRQGDVVGLSATAPKKVGSIVLANRDDDWWLKRLTEKKGGQLRLESDNREYEAIEGKDIRIVAVVVWSHRQY